MKYLKRLFLSLLFAVVLMFSFSQVDAADAEPVVLIYAEVPTEWESPHIWAWDDDGTGAFSNLGWPGKPMKEDTNNPGWYYLYVPESMTNIIINANEGTVQTDAFTIAGENVWVTITSEEVTGDDGTTTVYTGTPSTTQATTGDLPEYIATKYIYAYVPIDWDTAAIWAWENESGTGVYSTWPGEEMTLLDDGWFRTEVPQWADRVIINNFDTENGEQTVDLEISTNDSYIMITEMNEEDKYEASITLEKPVIIEDGFTLYITVPEDWTTVSLWAWSHPDGTNLYTTWPGEEIEYDSETGYYTVMIPTWVNRVIVNNGQTDDSAVQSVDFDVTGEDGYLYLEDENTEGKFELSFSLEPITDDDDDQNTGDDDDQNTGDDDDQNTGDDDDQNTGDDETEDSSMGTTLAIIGIGVVAVGAGIFFLSKKS